MTQRATTWSITINNPVGADEENIALARQKGWKIDGQMEKGKNGTPHYQLIVKTPQVRFSALKKAFPRAHIEVARNATALEQYVHKEDTREGELSQSNDKYPSMQKLWDMFAEYIDDIEDYRGSDQDAGMSEWTKDRWLEVFDDFIRDAILKGFVVETMAVNPQVRSCVKHFGFQMFLRSIDRQTDRQTPENNTGGGIINGDTSTDATETNSEQASSEWGSDAETEVSA